MRVRPCVTYRTVAICSGPSGEPRLELVVRWLGAETEWDLHRWETFWAESEDLVTLLMGTIGGAICCPRGV